MAPRDKFPSALTIHVEYSAVEAKALWCSSTFFEVNAPSHDQDTGMIWAAGLLHGKSATPEAADMRQQIPEHCTVNYYHPLHESNPTRIENINDMGVDESNTGVWAVAMTAPDLLSLALTLETFTRVYMGIGAQIRDNFFRHDSPSLKFIIRRNKVKNKTWESRYTVRLQIKGAANEKVNIFARRAMQQHRWMLWEGALMCDPLQILGENMSCGCKTEQEVARRWREFEALKSKSWKQR